MPSLQETGYEKVPFTSGLLIGIGETREERLEGLFALRELHARFGHIHELIIQNFRAKKGTRMENAREPPMDELQWTIAMARLIFGASMSIQAPPNLTPKYGIFASVGLSEPLCIMRLTEKLSLCLKYFFLTRTEVALSAKKSILGMCSEQNR